MYETYVGVPIDDMLWNKLAHMYPSGAYGAVGGATYLTDVNNGQVTRRLWRTFGPRGLGWGLELPDAITSVQQKAVIVKDATWTQATIPVAWFWYAFRLIGTGDPYSKARILTSGSSDNKEPGYAITGAMSSCIKKAISYLGHQNALYCGIVELKDIPSFPVDGAYMREEDD